MVAQTKHATNDFGAQDASSRTGRWKSRGRNPKESKALKEHLSVNERIEFAAVLFTASLFLAGFVNRHRRLDDDAFDDLLPEGGHLEQHQAIVQHADDETAQRRPQHRAVPAA